MPASSKRGAARGGGGDSKKQKRSSAGPPSPSPSPPPSPKSGKIPSVSLLPNFPDNANKFSAIINHDDKTKALFDPTCSMCGIGTEKENSGRIKKLRKMFSNVQEDNINADAEMHIQNAGCFVAMSLLNDTMTEVGKRVTTLNNTMVHLRDELQNIATINEQVASATTAAVGAAPVPSLLSDAAKQDSIDGSLFLVFTRLVMLYSDDVLETESSMVEQACIPWFEAFYKNEIVGFKKETFGSRIPATIGGAKELISIAFNISQTSSRGNYNWYVRRRYIIWLSHARMHHIFAVMFCIGPNDLTNAKF